MFANVPIKVYQMIITALSSEARDWIDWSRRREGGERGPQYRAALSSRVCNLCYSSNVNESMVTVRDCVDGGHCAVVGKSLLNSSR